MTPAPPARFAGVTFTEYPDSTPLEEVFAGWDLGDLTDEQRDTVAGCLDMVVRPLVEWGWARHGVRVLWSDAPDRRFVVESRAPLAGTAGFGDADTVVEDLAEVQVQVWAAAYGCLDVAGVCRMVCAPLAGDWLAGTGRPGPPGNGL